MQNVQVKGVGRGLGQLEMAWGEPVGLQLPFEG